MVDLCFFKVIYMSHISTTILKSFWKSCDNWHFRKFLRNYSTNVITFSLYKKLIKPPVFSLWLDNVVRAQVQLPVPSLWSEDQDKREDRRPEQQSRGRPGDRLAWSRCGSFLGTTDLAFTVQLTSSERYFTLKAFCFFEMGLVTWKLVLKIQKYIGSSPLEIFELLKQVGPPDTQFLTPE